MKDGVTILQLGSVARESIELKEYQPKILLIVKDEKHPLDFRWIDVPVLNDVWAEDIDSLLEKDEDSIKNLVQEIIDQDEEVEGDVVKLFEKGAKKLKFKNKNEVVDKCCELVEVNR